MSIPVVFNGVSYTIPQNGDINWGSNVTAYLIAIAAGALQKTGGSFTLSAEADFGAAYGLKALYYKSKTATPSTTGVLRLANSDVVAWRDVTDTSDISLGVDALGQLTLNSVPFQPRTLLSSHIFVGNASNLATDVAMTGDIGIDNAGLTAIQPSVIVNNDINASAAIAYSKLAALTVSKSLISDGSGVITTGWSYSSGNMTTTPNGALRLTDGTTNYVGLVAPASVTTHTYALPIAAGLAGQVLSWQAGGQLQWINAAGGGTINSGSQYQLAYYAANGATLSGLTLITGNRVLTSDANGLPIASTVTNTTLAFLDATSSIQGQLNGKEPTIGYTPANAALSNLASTAVNVDIAMGSHKLTGLSAGSTNGDSVRYEQLVGVYLPLAGGTMTGDIAMSGTQKITGLAAGTTNGDSVRYEQLFGQFLPLTGGTITGQLLINDTSALHLYGNDVSNQHIIFKIGTYGIGANDRSWRFIAGKNADTEWGNYSLRVMPYNSVSTGDLVLTSGGGQIRLGTGAADVADATTNFTENAVIASTGCDLKGTTTNDSAATGWIGEYVESTSGANTNAAATDVWDDLLSISLTAGDWDVSATAFWQPNGATWSGINIGISTTSGNSATGLTNGINRSNNSWASSSATPLNLFASIPLYRISLASTTTVYLKRMSSYSAGTPRTGGGAIRARRVR